MIERWVGGPTTKLDPGGSGLGVRGRWVRNGRGRAEGVPRDTLQHTRTPQNGQKLQ